VAEIQVERAEGVMTITISRPAKKNALTAAMYQTMADALADAQEDKAIRVILLRGSDGLRRLSAPDYEKAVTSGSARTPDSRLPCDALRRDVAPKTLAPAPRPEAQRQAFQSCFDHRGHEKTERANASPKNCDDQRGFQLAPDRLHRQLDEAALR